MPLVRRCSLFARLRTGIALSTVLTVLTSLGLAGDAAAVTHVDHRIQWSDADFVVQRDADGDRIAVEGATAWGRTGRPELPRQPFTFVVPRGMRAASIEIVDARWVEIENVALAEGGAPLSNENEPGREEAFGRVDVALMRADVYPAVPAVVGASNSMRGWSLAGLDVVPVRVSTNGRVERLEELRVRFELEIDPRSNDTVSRRVAWPGQAARDAALVRRVVENADDVARYAPSPGVDPSVARFDFQVDEREGLGRVARIVLEPIDMMILTNETLRTEFQRLADYRTQQGLRTFVVTLDDILAVARPGGDVQETVRNYLRTAYEQWGLSYLLLGGDAEIIAPRYARSSFYPTFGFTDVPADLYYAALDGNWNIDGDGIYAEPYQSFLETGDEADLVAELSIGRAPVKDVTQVANFIDKIIAYENPTAPDYAGRAIFMSEVLFPQDWVLGDPITLDGATYSEDIVFDSIIGGGNLMQSWRMYENYTEYPGAIPETKGAAIDSMTSGNFALVNHIGHGFYYNMSMGPGEQNIFVPDVDNLINNPGDRPFLLHALNCSSGAFDFDCLLERFIQVQDRGAVGSIGASRAAFPSTANVYQQAFYREVFVTRNVRVGDAQMVSRTEQAATTQVEGSHRWTHFGYHVFADPALRVWRQAPTTVSVSAPASVIAGQGDVTIGVSAGAGVANAVVALTRADGGSVVGTTDGAGQVTLSLEGLSDRVGTIDVVVTDANVMPNASTIDVLSAAAAHVRATPGSFVDAGGDADGQPEAGENIEWNFSFENDGGAAATDVSATLQIVSAPGITPVTMTRSVGALTAGQSKAAQPFVFDVDADAVDGTLATFDLEITADGTTWTQPVKFVVGAPEIDVARIRWDDSALGNGDGVIDAGETVDLIFEVSNYGGATINSLSATLTSLSPNVTVVDGSGAAVGAIGTREIGDVVGLRITESDVGVENDLQIELADDEGRVFSMVFDLRPPAAPPVPQLDTTFGQDRIVIRTDGITEPFVRGYRVYRREGTAGNFDEVSFDTIERTGFIEDAGLASLTRYGYRVSYVDSTGVEGDMSPLVEASTAPPEMAGGFPFPVTRELAGALAVGTMIEDGPKVVTFGADFIYAIDADGNELVNGDADAQTLGPLAGPANAQRFTPSGVAMADLDGDGLDEIITSNWENFEVWVVRADGSSFPGWPQTMNQKAWGTPVVADLDGDEDFEIIVNNTNRTTYVWHHDGTEFLDGDANPGTNGIFARRPTEVFGRTTSAVYDVDGDGTLEIIFPETRRDGVDNLVHAYKNDGSDAPGWPINVGVGGWCVSSPTIADVDDDGTVEIFLVTENDLLHAWAPDGTALPGYPKPLESRAGAKDSKHPAVAFGDFDDDGQLELVTVAIKGDADCDVFIQELDGTVLPGWPRSLPGLSESSPLVADVNGDQSLDVVFGIGGGSDNSPNQLYALNDDGTDVAGFPITLPGAVRAVPVVTDFDEDGDVDIVYAGFDLLLHVWDMPFAYDPALAPWATFQGNNHRTGVYGERIATSTPSVAFSARASVEGVVLEARFFGASTRDLVFVVDRIEGGSGAVERVAEGVRPNGTVFRWTDTTARPGASYTYRLSDAEGSFFFESGSVVVPTRRLAVEKAMPNPFNPSTTIVFEIPGIAGAQVPSVLEIFDVTGRRVRSLLSEPLGPGQHRAQWDGMDDDGRFVASGTYFAQLRAAGQTSSLKLTLVK